MKFLFSFFLLTIPLINIVSSQEISFGEKEFNNTKEFSITASTFLIPSFDRELTIDEIIKKEEQNLRFEKWGDVEKVSQNEEYLWFKVTLESSFKMPTSWVLNVGYLDDVTAFIVSENEIIDSLKTGFHIPYYQRSFVEDTWIRNYFKFVIPGQEKWDIYIRSKYPEQTLKYFKPTLISFNELNKLYKLKDLSQGFFHGMSLVLFFLSLTLFFSLKQNFYIFFSLQAIAFSLCYLPVFGYTSFFTSNYANDYIIWLLLINFAGISYIQFFRLVLKTKEIIPLLDKFLLAIIGLRLLIIPLGFYFVFFHNDYRPSALLVTFIDAFSVIIGIPTIIATFQKGGLFARFLLIGTSVLIISVILGVFNSRSLGLINVFQTDLFIQLGITLQSGILLVGFGFRIYFNLLKERRNKANELKKQDIFRKALEKKVETRTAELEKANQEIVIAHEEVKKINDKLKEANQNLEEKVEERTDILYLQNKVLKEYAFNHSHIIRAPLARIMGLVIAYRLEENLEDAAIYLDFIAKSADELDTIIRAMDEVLEKTKFFSE